VILRRVNRCECLADALLHGFTANQIARTIMAATIAAHIIGLARFELPLRGEWLAAWLNSLSITVRPLQRCHETWPVY
jgi:hypothetical protein